MAEQANESGRRGWFAKAAHLLAVLWIEFGLTLVLFAVLSMTAGAVVKRIRRARDVIPAPQDAYSGQSWTAQYF